MPKHGAHTTLPTSPTTPGNHNLDNLKCFECGKNGHFQSRCPNNLKCFECGKNGHFQSQCPNNLKCFECGKNGHFQSQCPNNLKCFECGKNGHFQSQCPNNLKCFECGKNGHFQSQCPNNLKYFECGMNGHFQNQCPNNKLFAPTQAFVVLSTDATTNLEDGNTPNFEASTSLPTPSSNCYLDNVKCFQCGKNGHYQNRCPERKSDNVKCFECGKGGHYQNQCSERKSDDVKCFECGKSGHYQRQCPKRKIPSPVQAYETLLPVATTNLEGGNMSKHGAPTTSSALPMTPDNHNLDNSKYCEWGKNEHFQNQCSDNKVFAPTQVDVVLPTIATTNLEEEAMYTTIKKREATVKKKRSGSQKKRSISQKKRSISQKKRSSSQKKRSDRGCDQEQVQAWGQIQSSPFGLTNIASSFDQSPKTDTPQLPVVVTSENNKGSGDTPYIATKTSVWWDIENCPVPRGNSDTYYLAQNISSALADAGYKGAVTISAYGDTHKIPNAVQQALSSTGIALNHVPAGVKDASDKKILVDMLFWAVDNPPPANYLLISGDRDFSNALHQLRLRRYNILLAHAPPVSQALVAAAKKVWQWASLLSGGPPLQDLELGTKTSSANKSSFNVIKGPIPKRLRWKDQNARETQKTFSESQNKEGCDIQSENHASFPRVSQPETSEITRLKCAPISSPSREIVCGKRPRDLVDSSEQIPFKSIFNLDNEKNSFNSQPFKLCRLFAPSNSAPSQNNNYYSSITQPNHQHIMFGPPHLQLMQNKSEIIQHPTNHHQNIKPSQIYNDNQNNVYQVHSSEAHRHIGHIVSALTELKTNKIAPTDENISNCIHYGMGKRSFNVKVALDYACENNMLTRYNLDNGALFYLGKNEQFWECVNVLDITDKHSEETWNAIQNFLSSASGQSAISSTECRYHAATVLKKACLQHLALGEVLQLLNTVIKFRKWIVPNPSGWQPLSFTLKVVS